MAIKKSELYSSIWQSCDELRGGMDASQYKDYVLVLLFMKYVTDKYKGQRDALIEVPEGGSFDDMVNVKNEAEVGDKVNKIINKLAEANDLKGVITVADFNDEDKLGKGKDQQDRLSKLIGIFQNPALDFSKNRADGDDILGDAYEYLMRHFATESGKSKGQFYTPSEVSRVMAKVIGIKEATRADQTMYDPTCGSGSLLLKASDEAAPVQVTIYGQEMDVATAALAQMNMILHNNPTGRIWKDNTLSSPHYVTEAGELTQFDFVVANPPFSSKAWTTGFNPNDDLFKRFEDGVPPDKNGDYAFLQHILKSLKSTGKGAVILPHGVLFRGNAEAEIRKKIIRKGYIKGIIGLPANLFYGTGIPACILVLDKEHAASRTGIFMIDASKGFVKDGNKNRLRHQDIHKIVDVFNKQLELAKYSRFVPNSEISDEKNDYNLNIPRYIDSSEPEDLQDIAAHLRGGIPNIDVDNLERYWAVFPSLKAELFEAGSRAGYSQVCVEPGQIKPTIFENLEFKVFTETTRQTFITWREQHRAILEGLEVGTPPKALIETLSENLLNAFVDNRLIDKYDVYQSLMTYWSETMQDDTYLITSDGWKTASQLRSLKADKDSKNKEKPDIEVDKQKLKADLIPPALVIARYFAAQQQALETLEAGRDEITRQLEELEEEHAVEGGMLEEVKNDKGKITTGNVEKRIKQLTNMFGSKPSEDDQAELTILRQYVSLSEQETKARIAMISARDALNIALVKQYHALSEAEIKTLVVHDKWFATLENAMQTELNRVSGALADRIKQLTERYKTPLPQLEADLEGLRAKVTAHLTKMGFTWN
jgi:type I restriction enzyme M protein